MACTMHWEAQEATQSDWDGTYLWVGHSRILVSKLVCDLSNLTQLIKGQQKTEPMTQTIVGSTKCKFPHPTDHFKFTFDRNTDNRNILFVSICSTQATMLAEREAEGLQVSSILDLLLNWNKIITHLPLPHFGGASATSEIISHGLGTACSSASLHLSQCPLLHPSYVFLQLQYIWWSVWHPPCPNSPNPM